MAMPNIGPPFGGQPYRGLTEPVFPSTPTGRASLASWRQGVDNALDLRAQPEDATIYAHRSCGTCRQIRSSWRDSDTWIDQSYWKPLRDVLPVDVLLDMSMAELHAIHHLGEGGYGDAIVFAGIRVLVTYFTSQDFVPRQEMNDRLSTQWSQMNTEIDQTKASARQAAMDALGEDLREYQMRVANVEALLHEAFGRKTLSRDAVNAAVDWRRGQEVLALTVQHQRLIRDLSHDRA